MGWAWWRRAAGLALHGAILGLWLASACGDGKSTRQCISGETRGCDGSDACRGTQVCAADGSGFGACDCTPPSSAVPEEMTSPEPTESEAPTPGCTPGERHDCQGPGGCAGRQACTSAGDGFGPCSCTPIPDTVGAACERTADCGPDLECWSASTRSYLGVVGGVPHGYCTAVCSSNNDCRQFDFNSACWSRPGQQGICVTRCLSKDPALIEAKCLNRLELTCWSVAALGQDSLAAGRQEGICLPACLSNADCGGRFCDLDTGLCVDAAPQGASIGEPCALDSECAGKLCLTFDNGAGVCSAKCTYGSGGCGYSAEPRGAVCGMPFLSDLLLSEGVGDLGTCLQLCDVDTDCSAPGAFCSVAQLNTGRAGFCDPSGPRSADAGP